MSEVRRETTLPNDPDEVWHAISDERELERWLGEEVELDSIESDDDEERRVAFTWTRPGDDESRVELTVRPDTIGSRLIVVERLGAGTGPMASAAAWTGRLTALREALALALA
jgi:uncharacterized protein YndB with AHSA1/START domain